MFPMVTSSILRLLLSITLISFFHFFPLPSFQPTDVKSTLSRERKGKAKDDVGLAERLRRPPRGLGTTEERTMRGRERRWIRLCSYRHRFWM